MIAFINVLSVFKSIYIILKNIEIDLENNLLNKDIIKNKDKPDIEILFYNISKDIYEYITNDAKKILQEIESTIIGFINDCISTSPKNKQALKLQIKDKVRLDNENYFVKLILELFRPNVQIYLGKMQSFKITLINNFMKEYPRYTLLSNLLKIKERGNRRLGNTGRKTLLNTYFSKNNNSKLPREIKDLINSETNKVYRQLGISNIENESNV